MILLCLLLTVLVVPRLGPRPWHERGCEADPVTAEATLDWLSGLISAVETGRPSIVVLCEVSAEHGVATDVVGALGIAGDVPLALRSSRLGDPQVLDAVASAWSLHVSLGVALRPVLHRALDALQDAAEVRRELAVEVAGPVTSARVVAALPLLAVGGLVLLGVDYGSLFSRPLVMAGVAGGVLLDLLGYLWLRRIISTAVPGG